MKFIVLTSPTTKEDDEAFVSKLKSAGWWHHLPGGWLIADPNNEFTAVSLQEILQGINPALSVLVVQIENSLGWASRLPTSISKPSSAWFAENWDDGVPPVER